MLKNHLLVALRKLRRQKGYAALNVLGLAVGLACCLLVALYVYDEWRYDRGHEAAGSVYRVTEHDLQSERHWAPVGPPVGRALADRFPEVEAVARFAALPDHVVLEAPASSPGEPIRARENAGLYADATVFEVFTLPLLAGDPATALAEPGALVLTERLARKYFGEADPLGQTVTLDGELELRVTGVMEDLPPTHLPFEFLVSMPTYYRILGAGPVPGGRDGRPRRRAPGGELPRHPSRYVRPHPCPPLRVTAPAEGRVTTRCG